MMYSEQNITNNTLERDIPGPVSVSPKGSDHPSYTYNADKSDPFDLHLSDNNPPTRVPLATDVEDDALNRDKPGPVSVAGRHPSYTYNADKSVPIDPHLADMSIH